MSRITRDFNRTTPRSNLPNNIKSNTPITPSQQEQALPIKDPQQVSSPGPSNIEKQTRYQKNNNVLIKTDPGSLVMAGMGNTISDYGGIVDGNYKDKSILNQSMGKAFEGDWEGAGTLIRENPYRFAGNLLVEAGLAVVPVGAVLKAAKITKLATTVLQHNKIAPVVTSVIKKVEPIKDTTQKVIDKITPTKKVYKIVEADEGKTFWAGNRPQLFYLNKVLHGNYKDAPPQLRSIDIPKSTPNVEKLIMTSDMVNPDNGKLVPRFFAHNETTGGFSPTPVKDADFPGKESLVEFITIPKGGKTPADAGYWEKEFATDYANNNKGTQIGKELYKDSRDWKDEYALKTNLQAKEKVMATLGEKESLFQRIIHPWYGDDKFANALSTGPKIKDDKYISYFKPWGQKEGDGISNYTHQGKPQSILFHNASVIQDKADKMKKTVAAGVITFGAFSFTKNDEAQINQDRYKIAPIVKAKVQTKRVKDNSGTFGGYGQFLQ